MKIIGHKKQIEFLKNSIYSGFFSQAYLFYGESKIGKKRVAIELAKILNSCQEGSRDCQDIEENKYPDVKMIEPQRKTDKGNFSIPISEIKSLRSFLSLKSLRGKYRVVIIDEAFYLRPDAQSALLKIVEEPPEKVVLILITEYPKMLISPLLSRVLSIHFSSVPIKEIESYLLENGLDKVKAKRIAYLSFGKPGLALDFVNSSQKLIVWADKVQKISQLVKSDLFLRFAYAKTLSLGDNRQVDEVLEIWLRYFRYLLREKLGLNSIIVADNYITDFPLQSYSLPKLIKIIKFIQEIKFLLSSTNINTRLALESLFINL